MNSVIVLSAKVPKEGSNENNIIITFVHIITHTKFFLNYKFGISNSNEVNITASVSPSLQKSPPSIMPQIQTLLKLIMLIELTGLQIHSV